MALSLESAAALLFEHGLLREIITRDGWTLNPSDVPGYRDQVTGLTYSTTQVVPGSALVCKGRFRAEYLQDIDQQRLAWYVATEDYSAYTAAPGLIVNNATQALSLLAAAYYDYPQDELTVIGITGTKGKTTTAYFTQAMLNALSGGKCALFSSNDNCIDGVHYVESDLTTPESLDAFRMMRQAREHGMEYLVMEVSSQSYKVNRVYGLHFDVAGFLNISPDHVSPIEHPTFEDYLYCKRQIIANTSALVLGADCDHVRLLLQDAHLHDVPVTLFGTEDSTLPDDGQSTPLGLVTVGAADERHDRFDVTVFGDPAGSIALAMPGDFNYVNAAAAIALIEAAGVPFNADVAYKALDEVRIAGRMETTRDDESNTVVIVDYAHNGISVTSVLDYVDLQWGQEQPSITLITGSAGGKALDRREEMVRAAEQRIDHFIFTTDDPNEEPVQDICEHMASYIQAPDVRHSIILDRAQAIASAIEEARADDSGRLHVILALGKGEERWIKAHGKHMPYEGDDHVVARLLHRL
ncbi:UDP-N-acetylmuramoyl-L-alanyl-D-glutamate--2,6-diaminopimelate ligase [Bifidobacterium gallicum]|uniref:UDP-N-acetylmuramoyl-L-alanyl-D-glutamate--2, 6-diaminopimelate ligase n=1 Tax=Bifidobacterium gallicum DSM 20093 = LMG 11596 TaxID=561180 RepID=D1NSY3_9BIFI|nr:UDP-N-acetylmuramoyl-L-alanyl-D-glutamate--2,6-diaminopimelate ligase [Bifidobacterium gallicum]EFA23785.1 UDP-N-acetylmuramoyl-L-alanyl-D-glutamate--2,6-diaminopimelate ligase [Bifidobacterium gallicum DSM 20093 = LMG 11596]KFI59206.1 UDP-N-acetylmuramoylalanyl-D-glutamate--2,6- diaminopimelate ligase [Bifidobacterium gallicum DSM 20093 = LMG 11596]